MIQLVIYTACAMIRCGVLICATNTLFPGVLGVLLGFTIFCGSIIEYSVFCSMICKVSNLEKRENSQKNHTL